VEDKVHYGDRIATFVATGMHKLWGRRAYVELFSGPGVSFDRGHHRFIEGSALRALQRDFTDYIFVDLDPTAATALEERIARLAPPGRRTRVIQGDCNEVAGEVLDSIPRRALSLLFVDPSSWEVRFETIASLVADRRLDLLVTFHVGAMKRARWAQPASLDAFFGTPDWRAPSTCRESSARRPSCGCTTANWSRTATCRAATSTGRPSETRATS
jgi:three-Cys-motif partner protein